LRHSGVTWRSPAQWVFGLIAPIADLGVALVEAVVDEKPTEDFWVRFEPVN
jgi:hypothetical protein